MVYGAISLPTFTYTVSGLVNGDTTTVATTTSATPYSGVAGSVSNVGGYPITATLSNNPNYTVNSVDGTLTVNPVAITVAANNQATSYGSPLVLPQAAFSTLDANNQLITLPNGDYIASASILSSTTNSQVVSGLVNAGNYIGNIVIGNATGLRLSNYNITYRAANLVISPVVLTVTVVSDAKFVIQSDAQGSSLNCGGSPCAGGYSGVMYSGFKNSDTVLNSINTSGLSITRLNASVQDAGVYPNVLQASGLSTINSNYTLDYKNGTYTIVPASQLLVGVGVVETIYGTAPNFTSVTAQYLNNSNQIIANLPVNISGSNVSVTDGYGGSAQFTLSVVNPNSSSSGNTNVGNYALQASSATITGNNYSNNLVIIGGYTVKPKVLTFADLNISGISKVYDSNTYMNSLAVNSSASPFILGDQVNMQATGPFASKNVGAGLAYTVGINFTSHGNRIDSGNYALPDGGVYSGNNGIITQLNSVTYTGGLWANPLN